jgi:hypothetical protein
VATGIRVMYFSPVGTCVPAKLALSK